MGEQIFEEEVLQSQAPVLVHFGAPWCSPCRMIEPLISRFQAEHGNFFKLVGINADESLKLASHYRITKLPTLLVFSDGELLHRVEGLDKREALWAELLKLLPNPLRKTSLPS